MYYITGHWNRIQWITKIILENVQIDYLKWFVYFLVAAKFDDCLWLYSGMDLEYNDKV